jgi:hypothetical protein
MTKHLPIRVIKLSTILLLLSGPVGCAFSASDDSTTATADATLILDKLSPAAREMALKNQAQHERDGLRLAGRVWFAPDVYGEIYDDTTGTEGEGTAHFVARGNSPLAKEIALHPGETETLDEYIARTRPGVSKVRFNLDSGASSIDGLDVLLFEPTPSTASAGDVGKAESAVITNEFCPLDTMNALCAQNFGWAGPVTPALLVDEWAVPDSFGGTSSPLTGTSFNTAVCADRGSARMTIFRDNKVAGTPRDVSQGFADSSRFRVGWAEIKWCSTMGPFICLDYHYSINFFRKSWKQQIEVFGTGANAHVCGRVKDNKDKEQDEGCKVRKNCPVETN